MIFKYEGIDLEIDFSNTPFVTLQIESPLLLRDFLFNLVNEVNGREGNILLHNNGKSINVGKSIEYIDSLLMIDYSNKKLVTKLYQEVEEIANTEMIEETGKFQSVLIDYLSQISEKLSYSVDFDEILNLNGLLKNSNFAFSYEGQDFAERLITYIRLLHTVCGVHAFITLHMKEYFTESEYDAIVNTLSYEEVYVLNIETKDYKRNPLEKVVVIDSDKCIIEC